MNLKDIANAFEAYDTICPCSSNEESRRDWFADVDATLPWDEIGFEFLEEGHEYQNLAEDILSLFLQMAGSPEKTQGERLTNAERLMAVPQIPQRTAEWYEQTKHVLTASEFSVILGTPRAIGTLAVAKAAPPPPPDQPRPTNRLACSTLEMGPMDWGVRFEPVVKHILTTLWEAEIIELGRLVHPTDNRLAASPDGLVLKAADPRRVGRLVEIKCPIRREMTEKIPFEYWCQMQIQMEVTDVDECEYVEVKINSGYKNVSMCEEEKEGSQRKNYHGTVWLIQEPDTTELKYAYNSQEVADFSALGWNVVETIPWSLDKIAIQVVRRDRAWFQSTETARADFWAKVADAKTGIFVLAPSSRKVAATVDDPLSSSTATNTAANTAAKGRGLVVNVCKIED